MLIFIALLACDTGTPADDDTGADTGAADAAGGQEGEELIGDTGDVDTDGSDSAALSADTAAVTFGTRLIGCSTEQSVTITNDTGAPVSLDELGLDDGDELSVAAPALPMQLAPGDSAALTVRYAPLAEGELQSTLSVYTDQGLDLEISLGGQGALFAPGDDTFVSDGGPLFSLSQAAVAQTLSVTVDGAPLPETEWSYSAAEQQLVLTTPAPDGAAVAITYAVQPPTCD